MTGPAEDDQESTTLLPRSGFTRTTENYVFSVLGYFAIAVVDKTFLTFTMALLYFVLTLDVLPRIYTLVKRRIGR